MLWHDLGALCFCSAYTQAECVLQSGVVLTDHSIVDIIVPAFEANFSVVSFGGLGSDLVFRVDPALGQSPWFLCIPSAALSFFHLPPSVSAYAGTPFNRISRVLFTLDTHNRTFVLGDVQRPPFTVLVRCRVLTKASF